jgi:hypothetical protein
MRSNACASAWPKHNMGTFDHSKLRQARTDKTCVACHKQIHAGTRYLDYRPGLYWHVPLHISCALQRAERYQCAALKGSA